VLDHFGVAFTLDLTGAQITAVEPLVEALGGLYKMKRLRIGDNPMSAEDIETLVAFMRRFNAKNGPSWVEVGGDPALAAMTTRSACHPHSKWGCVCAERARVHVVKHLKAHDAKDIYLWEVSNGFWAQPKTQPKTPKMCAQEASPERGAGPSLRPPLGLPPPRPPMPEVTPPPPPRSPPGLPPPPPPTPPPPHHRPPPPSCTPNQVEQPPRNIAEELEMLAKFRARWRSALDASLTVQIDGKSFAVVVSSGHYSLMDIVRSEGEGETVDPFGRPLGREVQLLPAAACLQGVARRTVVAQGGSYLNIDQGELVVLNMRRCEMETGKVWVAARTADSDFLWFELSDAGV